MCCPERKSIEPIALCTGTGQVSGLQKFIAVAPWQSDDVTTEIQSVFADELAPSAAGTPVGTVGVLDESGFSKKGTKSAGVARQHNGRLGKEDNCQVGVFLIGAAPAGSALLGHGLYLHESWYQGDEDEAARRRAEAYIPEDTPFLTKPQIAAALVRDVLVTGIVGLDWVTADEAYGQNGELLDELEVPTTTTVWTADPASCIPPYSGRGQPPRRPRRDAVRSVAELAADLPAEAWQRLQVREGAVGPLVFEFAAVRAWAVRHRKPGPPIWVLIHCSLEAKPELKYYVSNGDAATPLGVLAGVACTRHRVEDFLEECKSDLGMAQYEMRSCIGWHHHMALVGLAYLFVVLTWLRLKKSGGPDAGPDGAVAGGGAGGAGAEVGTGGRSGGIPHPSESCGQSFT